MSALTSIAGLKKRRIAVRASSRFGLLFAVVVFAVDILATGMGFVRVLSRYVDFLVMAFNPVHYAKSRRPLTRFPARHVGVPPSPPRGDVSSFAHSKPISQPPEFDLAGSKGTIAPPWRSPEIEQRVAAGAAALYTSFSHEIKRRSNDVGRKKAWRICWIAPSERKKRVCLCSKFSRAKVLI